MHQLLALVALGATAALHAQIALPLPPSAPPTPDIFSNASLWDAQLNHVTLTGDAYAPIGPLAAADGITMGGSAPLAAPDMIAIRIIFLGESAGWKNDFGYTFGSSTIVSGPPATASTMHSSARTLAHDINREVPSPAVFTFWDIPVTGATFGWFDIWLNASSSFDASNPSPTTTGGLYHAFHPSWDNPVESGLKAFWSQPFALETNYFDLDLGFISKLETTWLLTFEDLRDASTDGDRSDLVLGVQIIHEGGRPNSGVPEPTTYGLLGTAALLSLIALRRRVR